MLYRAFYALPDSIKGADGQPVNALLGSANLILREVEEHAPRAVVLCFGPDAAEYRVELLRRLPRRTARDARRARPPVGASAGRSSRRSAGGSPSHDSLEADDLLGTLARRRTKAGGRALILTGDRDMFQCATKAVTVLYVQHRRRRAPRWSAPRRSRSATGSRRAGPDFIALRGDPSDGIPGAKGVGEKTAAELLREYGSLEGLLDKAIRDHAAQAALHADRVRRRPARLQGHRDAARRRSQAAEGPPHRPCHGGGCGEELGMNRLAERLRKEAP